MKQLAEGVHQLSLFPPNAINVYLVEDVLIDAASRYDTRFILKQLRGRKLSAHALTHAHADHQGASHAVCEEFGVPYWVGAADAPAAADVEVMRARANDDFRARLFAKYASGPSHHVDRELKEGDEVAGFKVLEVPGHSIGHVAFWRESDRVLIAGDVLNSAHPFTMIRGLREPPDYFTTNPAENRRSAKRLGTLEPKLVLLGHGPPVRGTKKFVDFVNALPD